MSKTRCSAVSFSLVRKEIFEQGGEGPLLLKKAIREWRRARLIPRNESMTGDTFTVPSSTSSMLWLLDSRISKDMVSSMGNQGYHLQFAVKPLFFNSVLL